MSLPSLLLALAASAVSAAAPAAPALRIGVAAAVRGPVNALSPGKGAVGRLVESGRPIFMGDRIVTGKDGGLQILLLDETVFTIGPDSTLVIDEFVYDPSRDSGKVAASVLKGVFRFVSGKVARKDSDAMKVKLPVGTIGIRGTIVAGRVSGAAGAERAFVMLVQGEIALDQVGIRRPGYGSYWDAGKPPSPPIPAPAAELKIIGDLSPRHQPPPRGARPPGRIDGRGPGPDGRRPMHPGPRLPPLDQTANSFFRPPVPDGPSRWEDIRGFIQSGKAHFSMTKSDGFRQSTCSGAACDVRSLLKMDLNIDFGARTVGGDCGGTCNKSQFVIGSNLGNGGSISTNLTADVGTVSFASLGGQAITPLPLVNSPPPGITGASVSLQNRDGKIAGSAIGSVTFENGGGYNQGGGSIEAPGAPGAL